MTFRFQPARLCAVAMAFSFAGAVQAQPWPMYQGDASHTGYAPVTVSPDDIKPAWSRQLTDGSIGLSGVAVAFNRLYVSTTGYFNGQYLYAMTASTGNSLWQVDYGAVYSVNPPSYADGTVYVQTGNSSDDSWLRGLDAVTGEQKFQTQHYAQWERYLAPTIFRNRVYVNAGSYGGMQAFRKDTGASQWFYYLPQYDHWTPAVDANYAYSFVGGTLFVVNREPGTLAFSVDDPGSGWWSYGTEQAPVLGGLNDVYVTSNGRLLRFDTARQRLVWKKEDASYFGQPSVANFVVYAPSTAGVVARSQTTGDRLWTWFVPSTERVKSNLVITNGHLFVATGSSTYCVDLTTHKTVWSTPVTGKLAVAGGYLYISGVYGLLTAVKLTP